MKVSVRQISVVSKPKCTFYLKLEWAKDLGAGFVVLLSDGISAWSGEVSEEDVTREAQDMEMQRDMYVRDLQLALTEESQVEQRYSFHLAADGNVFQLSYEKVQNDISFRLGILELLPVPEPTDVIRELISYGLGRSTCLQAKNNQLLEENQRLRNEQEHITAEMARYVQGKETLESDLYYRFVLVLNEKKAKIRALQEKIKHLQNTIEKEEQRSAIPDKETDYGSTTDEEQEEVSKLLPSKSTNEEVLTSSPMDDSLNDITDIAPSRKRRHRHLQQLELQNKRLALEKIHSSRNELPEEVKAETNNAAVQKSAKVSHDPHDLLDDI